jgi:hypothetical protein
MSYTLQQAAEATGKDKSTIQRAIKKGRISATKNDLGNYIIDQVELYRVFPAAISNDATPMALQQVATYENAIENRFLNDKVKMLQELLEDMRQQRDKWQEQAEAVKVLTHQKANQNAPAIKLRAVRPWLWGVLVIVGIFAAAITLLHEAGRF